VGFVLLWDPPLLFTHQYNYYKNGLRIAEQADPVSYVLSSDEWRAWVGGSTIAPLYYLFLGAFFRWFGPGLLPLRLVQAGLDAVVAVAVASLGRRACGPAGLLAGVAYAFYWSAVEMTCWTMTENLHTVLVVGSFAVMAREADSSLGGSRWRALAGGLLLGLSGLTRSVSSAFVPLAALWRASLAGLALRTLALRGAGGAESRRRLAPALLLLVGGLLAVFPWSLRNRMRGDEVPIETVGFYNLWDDNSRPLLTKERYDRQLKTLQAQPTPGDYGSTALRLTARNILRNPVRFLGKVAFNFRHFVRPEGLHNLLVKEYPDPPLRHAGGIVFDDLLLLLAVPFFAAFLLGGPSSPTRRLIAWWTAYYLFMVLVVFHTEARYRSPLVPVVFAGAFGGLVALRDPSVPARRRLLLTGLALGSLVSLGTVARYVGPTIRAVRSTYALAPARAAVERGDVKAALQTAEEAAALDPTAARPWRTFGRWLAARDHSAEAEIAYARAAASPTAFGWTSASVRPRLLLDAGRTEEAEAALRTAHVLSWDVDPWILLEAAWRELNAPRADEVRLGSFDYGAVRGFHHPRGIDPKLVRHRREIRDYNAAGGSVPPPGLHRWSGKAAYLRLRPLRSAALYTVTLGMGSPFPSPVPSPTVEVCINGGVAQRATLSPEIREYRFDAVARPDGLVLVRLNAPTWGRFGEPADQGVRVELLRVDPKTPN
jgi:hypothetical protein